MMTVLLAALALTACEDIFESRDGDWTPMKWSHPKYETVKDGGSTYYWVPVEGGDFGFRCKNYTPWLSSDHTFQIGDVVWHSYLESAVDTDPWHRYANSWCEVVAVEDSVKVHFEPNTGATRKASISVTAGDIFDGFSFMQASAPNTEEGKQ